MSDQTAQVEWKRETPDFDLETKSAPHPGLNCGHRRAVELGFGMANGLIAVSMRVCLACSFVIPFGLDSDREDADPPRHEPVLVNPDEVEAAMAGAERC
jgi:hypothetical protein